MIQVYFMDSGAAPIGTTLVTWKDAARWTGFNALATPNLSSQITPHVSMAHDGKPPHTVVGFLSLGQPYHRSTSA